LETRQLMSETRRGI